jgi:hypothetical protein
MNQPRQRVRNTLRLVVDVSIVGAEVAKITGTLLFEIIIAKSAILLHAVQGMTRSGKRYTETEPSGADD